MNLPKGPDSLCFDKDVFMKVGRLLMSLPLIVVVVASCRKQSHKIDYL